MHSLSHTSIIILLQLFIFLWFHETKSGRTAAPCSFYLLTFFFKLSAAATFSIIIIFSDSFIKTQLSRNISKFKFRDIGQQKAKVIHDFCSDSVRYDFRIALHWLNE